MPEDNKQEKQPYEETVESAKLFEDIEQSRIKQAAEKPSEQEGSKQPSSEEQDKAAEPSIGELFSTLVRMSPEDKIRIESDSIGSLFKKYINKRG